MRPSQSCVFRLLACLAFSAACIGQSVPAPRVVDLTAADGLLLKATYFAAGRPGPGVLLFHECNRQRKVWNELAGRLASSGINVLTLDFRGFGESGGTPYATLSPEQRGKVVTEKFPSDVDTAFRYLVSQAGVTRDRIGAGGASCGVNQSVQLARRHPEVKSLALLSDITDSAGRNFLRRSPGIPLFLAVADDDGDYGVVDFMKWLLSLSPNPQNQFHQYSNGGHGVDMFAAHLELPVKIAEWFATTLNTNPSSATPDSHPPAASENSFLKQVDLPDGPGKAAQLFADARQRDPAAVLFPEAIMNRLGYERLQSGDTKGAVELMKLNVMAYPESANVYDSLSDAYLADGQKDLARQNAKLALEHLATDATDSEVRRNGIKDNAEKKLKQ